MARYEMEEIEITHGNYSQNLWKNGRIIMVRTPPDEMWEYLERNMRPGDTYQEVYMAGGGRSRVFSRQDVLEIVAERRQWDAQHLYCEL